VENVSRLEQLTSFAPNARLVTDFVFGDDHELISVGYDSNISVWSGDTGKEIRQIGNDQAGALVVAINSDGSLIATGGTVSDPAVRVWNTQSGEMDQLGIHPPYLTSLAFNLDGTRLASGSGDDSVIVWDVNNGQLLMTLNGDVSGRHQLFRSLYWKDGSTLIAAGSDAIYWWDTTTGSLLQRLAKPLKLIFWSTLPSAKTVTGWLLPPRMPTYISGIRQLVNGHAGPPWLGVGSAVSVSAQMGSWWWVELATTGCWCGTSRLDNCLQDIRRSVVPLLLFDLVQVGSISLLEDGMAQFDYGESPDLITIDHLAGSTNNLIAVIASIYPVCSRQPPAGSAH
jgi:WD40 repeat protein